MVFTEEEAKDALERLGFDVLDGAEGVHKGYSIEVDREHDCYVVYELVEYPSHGTLRSNLSGWSVGFTLVEALQWLQAQIKEGKA